MAQQQKKQKGSLKVIGRVIGYMVRSYKLPFLLVIVCIIAQSLAMLNGTLFMQKLIDDYVTPMLGSASPDFSGLASALAGLIAVYVVGIICAYAYNRIMVTIGQGTMRNLRNDLFNHMESLPISYFDTHAHGDIMSVYTNDVDTLRQLINQSIPQIINSAVTLVSVIISMFVLTVPLSLITVLMACVMIFTATKLGSRSSYYFTKQQSDLGKVNGYIEEMMDGQKVVKVFCHEEKSVEAFRTLNEQLRDSATQANGFANIMMPVCSNLGNLSYVLCAIAGGVLALGGVGTLTLGTLVSFLSLSKSFTQPLSQISQQMNSIIMAAAGANRVFALLDAEPESDDGYVELVTVKENRDGTLSETDERTNLWAWRHPHKADGTVTYTPLKGRVTFENVNFGYTPAKQILYDITMYAEPGQKLAFVGSTGAGKTTITNLINRFYDIQSGKIRVDGINIAKIKKGDLRRSLGMVLQDTHLFTGTVMENIRYGRLDADDAECMAAARLANADDFIRRLPDGYNTMLTGDGANLSQGQRQLLAIARAAVADPPMLILDEATSSIDTRTEILVQQGMDGLMYGRTSFVIAHRLSTVRNSDCIMVMEQGRIIERGTHDQLMAQNGKYHQLYTGGLSEETA